MVYLYQDDTSIQSGWYLHLEQPVSAGVHIGASILKANELRTRV